MRASLTLLAALAVGCGSAPTPSRPRAPTPTEPPPVNARIHVSNLRGFDDYGGLRREGRMAHLGARYHVFGGWRVELLDATRSDVAEDAFVSAISDAKACGDGWVFVTWRGTIAYADSFAGPARRIGTVPWRDSDPRHRLRTNDGVVLYTGARGLALSGPCEGPMRRVDAVPGDLVSDVWGGDERRLAIVGGRHLFRSQDAGQSWQRVQVDRSPEAPFTRDGRFEIDDAWFAVDEAGRAVTAQEPSYEERRWEERRQASPLPDVGRGADTRASLALLRERAEARAALRPALEDGASVTLGYGGRRLARVDGRGIHWIDLPAEGRCQLGWLGRRLLVSCGEVVAISPDGRHLREVAIPGQGARVDPYTKTGEDGRQLALEGSCEDASDRRSFCVVDVETEEARTFALPEDAELLALHGDHGVFRQRLPDAWTLFTMDLRSGARRTILPGSEGHSGPVMSVRLGPDGSSFTGLLGERGEDQVLSWTVIRWRDGTLERLPLPRGATRAAFLDPDWGVAVGGSSDRVWLSEDAGRSWQRLADPFERAIPLRIAPRGGDPRVACWQTGCSAGLLWIERAPAPDPSPRWIVPGPHAEPGARRLPERPLRLTCRAVATVEEHHPAAERSGRGLSLTDASEARGPGWSLRIEGRGSRRVIAWSGTDAQGEFTAQSARLPVGSLVAENLRSPRCSPLTFDRRRLLLRCCGEQPPAEDGNDEAYDAFGGSECGVVGVGAGGGASEIWPNELIDDVLWAADGLFLFGFEDYRSTTVLEVGADGAVAGRHHWRWPLRVSASADPTGEQEMEVGLALLDGAAALLRQLPRPGAPTAMAERIEPTATARTVELPTSQSPLAACAAADEGGLVLPVKLASTEWSDGADLFRRDSIAGLHLDGHGSCVRWIRSDGLQLGSRVQLAAGEAGLEGHVDLLDGRRVDVVCQSASAPRSWERLF